MSQLSALAGMLGGAGSPIGGAGPTKTGAGTPSMIDPNPAATAAANAAAARGPAQMTPAQLAAMQHQYELDNPVRGQVGTQRGAVGTGIGTNIGGGDILRAPLFPKDMLNRRNAIIDALQGAGS